MPLWVQDLLRILGDYVNRRVSLRQVLAARWRLEFLRSRLVPCKRQRALWGLFAGPSRVRRRMRELSEAVDTRVHDQLSQCDRLLEQGTTHQRLLRSAVSDLCG
jgi:hypothetical protein